MSQRQQYQYTVIQRDYDHYDEDDAKVNAIVVGTFSTLEAANNAARKQPRSKPTIPSRDLMVWKKTLTLLATTEQIVRPARTTATTLRFGSKKKPLQALPREPRPAKCNTNAGQLPGHVYVLIHTDCEPVKKSRINHTTDILGAYLVYDKAYKSAKDFAEEPWEIQGGEDAEGVYQESADY